MATKRRIVIVLAFVLSATVGWCAAGTLGKGVPAQATLYKDGSWETDDGRRGCILFDPCMGW